MKGLIAAIVACFALLLAISIRIAVHADDRLGPARDVRITLDISPKPIRPMQPLLFTVSAPGSEGDAAWVDLAMPGMTMPPNRVTLRRGADGAFHGTGTVVRCMSGRRTWIAAVNFPGKPPASFTFDVSD